MRLFPDLEEILQSQVDNPANINDFQYMIENEIQQNTSLSISYWKRLLNFINNFRRFLEIEKIKYIKNITLRTAIKYRNWKLNTPSQRKNKNISPKTVRDELMFLKNNVFECAVDEELIGRNPFKNAIKNLRVYQNEK